LGSAPPDDLISGGAGGQAAVTRRLCKRPATRQPSPVLAARGAALRAD